MVYATVTAPAHGKAIRPGCYWASLPSLRADPAGRGRQDAVQRCTPQKLALTQIQRVRAGRIAVRSASSQAQAAAPSQGESTRQQEIASLQDLVSDLRKAKIMDDKVKVLLGRNRVQEFLSQSPRVKQLMRVLPPQQAQVLLCLPALGQAHVFANLAEDNETVLAKMQQLAVALCKADEFYSSLGGIVGYHAKCLELIQDSQSQAGQDSTGEAVQFHMPQGPNLDGLTGQHIAAVEAAKGLEALPHMAEIWPLGGAGDRLGLKCEVTGDSVPTAMLPYCGRTLLEGLVRDLQARESLYFKMYGVQYTTPVVIMTSDAKKNDFLVRKLLQSFNWFGRGEENFRVICQPMVPVVSVVDGRWVLPESLAPMMKPGGHGAIWKLMLDRGAFSWLASLDRQAALIRQISNPMAGTDATMLALTGAGYADGRTFGFASCDRRAGATEGVNVLMQRQVPKLGGGVEYAYNVTNVEYTEFDRLGIKEEEAAGSAEAALPANTNILYVSLKAAEGAVKAGVASGGGAALPGLIFNGKKTVSWVDASKGEACTQPAGRMECTMQNLVDSLAQRFQEPIPLERHAELKTFAVFNKRRRVTSSAKRKRQPGSTAISQTPDGSFLDLMHNSREVLQRCGFTTPEVGDVEHFLEHGPGFIFLFHPCLGPLWDIIAQKVRGGALTPGSELILEVGEASIVDLRLDGSLTVQASCIYGQSPATSARQDALRGGLLPVAGQAVSYPETGSEAIQYSQAIPDLAQASSMVVPLHRKKAPLPDVGGQHRSRAASNLPWDNQDWGDSRTVFSSQCARVRLNGVVVQNKGIDWGHPDNVYWQHKVARKEQVSIVLHGQSEFEASHVVLIGSHTFEVPDGYKMVVSATPGGGIRRTLSPLTGRRPSWQWRCLSGPEGVIQVKMEEPISPLPGVPLTSRPMQTDLPFTYMI